MSSSWRLMILLLAVATSSSSVFGFSIQYRGNTQHPTLPAHCYYEELELAVPVNETIYPVNHADLCAQIYCREDYVLMLRHCDRMVLATGCYFMPNDYSLPHPYCCAERICSD